MKVRITDLLDNYYDTSVKLSPPQEISGQADQPKTRGRSARKPLLVAAALMLVVTGAAVLGLRFQNGSPGGHALAEGSETADSLQGASAAEPDWEETEATPEPTIAASAWEDDGQETNDTIPFEVSGYSQQGNKLQFSLAVHDVPAGCTVELQPGDVYSNVINEAWVEDVTGQILGEGWEESGERSVNATVELSEKGGPLVFRVACYDEEQNYVFTETESIPVADFDRFVLWSDNGICEYCVEVLSDISARVTQLDVTQDTLEFLIQIPADVELVEGNIDLTDETLLQEARDWADALFAYTQSNLMVVYLNDGSTADIIAEDYGCELTGAGMSGEKGTAAVRLTITLENSIDPLAIDRVEFQSQSVPAAEDDTESTDAEKAESNGLLTAWMDLLITATASGQEWDGTLTRLTLDPETGDFTWYFRSTYLEDTMYALSPEGDFDTALHNGEFNAQFTALGNDLLSSYCSSARLIFTDGSSMTLYDGNEVGYTEGEFWTRYNLYWLAEDLELDLDGLAPAYLEIDGVRYDFQ